jgi:hypothetical protein
MNTNKILNISSNYNIRLLFSYLEYDSFVKIIKYNKLIQDKLNIKIDYNHYYDIKKSKCHIQKSKNQLIDYSIIHHSLIQLYLRLFLLVTHFFLFLMNYLLLIS